MYKDLDRTKPCPFPLPAHCVYLGEDADGYYHMDGFFDGLTNMFKRMVKFTPKSFQPKNLLKAFTNTTVGVATGGLAYLAPKQLRQTIFKAGETIVPIVAAGAVAAAAAPAVMGMLGPKLQSAAGILGKNANSIGGGLFKILGRLTEGGQSTVAQNTTADDIVYAEQHGQLPPHLQALVDQQDRAQFEYAAAQTANSIMNPAQQMLAPVERGTPSVYYGLIQEHQKKLEEAQSAHSDQLLTMSAMAGGALLLILLIKK